MKTNLFVIALPLLAACNSPTYYKITAEKPLAPLPRASKVYVGVSPDTFAQPGTLSANAFALAAESIFTEVKLGVDRADPEHNLLAAQNAGCRYLFLPRIVQWEDNYPSWSANPDRLGVQVTTVDVTSKESNVGTVLITGPWWTLCKFTPDEFMEYAVRHYLRYVVGDCKELEGTVD